MDSAADPRVDVGDPELVNGEWIRPADALARFQAGRVLMAPPTQGLLEALMVGAMAAPAKFMDADEARGAAPTHGRVRPNITLFPVRTPTLPPATHTNCYVVGTSELLIVEPASPYPVDQAALDAYLEARVAAGACALARAPTADDGGRGQGVDGQRRHDRLHSGRASCETGAGVQAGRSRTRWPSRWRISTSKPTSSPAGSI